MDHIKEFVLSYLSEHGDSFPKLIGPKDKNVNFLKTENPFLEWKDPKLKKKNQSIKTP